MDQRRETKRTGMPPEKLQPPLARSLGGGLRSSLPALCGFNDNGYKPRRTTTGLKGTRNLHPLPPFPPTTSFFSRLSSPPNPQRRSLNTTLIKGHSLARRRGACAYANGFTAGRSSDPPDLSSVLPPYTYACLLLSLSLTHTHIPSPSFIRTCPIKVSFCHPFGTKPNRMPNQTRARCQMNAYCRPWLRIPMKG